MNSRQETGKKRDRTLVGSELPIAGSPGAALPGARPALLRSEAENDRRGTSFSEREMGKGLVRVDARRVGKKTGERFSSSGTGER